MKRRLARGTQPPVQKRPETDFDYRRLLLEDKMRHVVARLKKCPEERPRVISLLSDSSTVVMLRAAKAMEYATK